MQRVLVDYVGIEVHFVSMTSWSITEFLGKLLVFFAMCLTILAWWFLIKLPLLVFQTLVVDTQICPHFKNLVDSFVFVVLNIADTTVTCKFACDRFFFYFYICVFILKWKKKHTHTHTHKCLKSFSTNFFLVIDLVAWQKNKNKWK